MTITITAGQVNCYNMFKSLLIKRRLNNAEDNEQLGVIKAIWYYSTFGMHTGSIKESIEKLNVEWNEYMTNFSKLYPNLDFNFRSKFYRYYYHDYNLTFASERCIEVPIIMDKIQHCQGNILEVGNVIQYYFKNHHTVVDKYEQIKGHNIINQDIIDYNPQGKYDLIVSISTLEHIGFNEEPSGSNIIDSNKIIKVVEHLKSLLNDNGEIIATVPVNYNSILDNYIENNRIDLGIKYYMKRTGFGVWEEVNTWDDVKFAKCGEPFPYANGIVIFDYKKVN